MWISGFFGSGKSSFAKNLGYALKNETLRGKGFAELFKQQIDDERANNFLDSITARVPTEVMLFEAAKERDTRKVTERNAELMYTVLLREFDYAEDFDIAELEIELEAEGKLDEFLHPQEWRLVRKGAQDEKNAVITYQSRLQDKLTQLMEKGTGLFQGVARETASLGKNLSEVHKTLINIGFY